MSNIFIKYMLYNLKFNLHITWRQRYTDGSTLYDICYFSNVNKYNIYKIIYPVYNFFFSFTVVFLFGFSIDKFLYALLGIITIF